MMIISPGTYEQQKVNKVVEKNSTMISCHHFILHPMILTSITQSSAIFSLRNVFLNVLGIVSP